MPIIPGTQEAETGGLWSEGSPGKSSRPYLKKTGKSKRIEYGSKGGGLAEV
jgi:hypothetical protein